MVFTGQQAPFFRQKRTYYGGLKKKKVLLSDQRAVQLEISWEEWDYRFHFSFEVLDFVKDVRNVEISNLDPKNTVHVLASYRIIFYTFDMPLP